MSREFSKYQKAIFSFMSDETGNAVVEAVAGSGKTTTIVEALKFTKPTDKVLFVAFNKHIAEELARRVPQNVKASTLNSVGWGICRANVTGVTLDVQKDDGILRTFLSTDIEEERKLYYKIRGATGKIVSLMKALLIDNPERDCEITAAKYGIEPPETSKDNPNFSFWETVVKVFAKSAAITKYMNFDDQIFQPVDKNWGMPKYEWVFGDEAQDWSPVQIELVRRLGTGGRIIAVGDRHQSIYGFRGADPDAIPNIITGLDAAVLPLSICYRCPDAVIAAAKDIVSHIEAPENNPKGEGSVVTVTTAEFLATVADGDFVLCRTTAPLVKRCLDMIRKGRKAVVKGRDIGKGLYDLLEQLAPYPSTPVVTFLEKLLQYKSEKMEKLAKANREAESMALEDKCDTLEVLAFECNKTSDIKKRIDTIFSDSDSSGITFCTGHRSKGLEANNIWILRPDLCPHPKCKEGWQLIQEHNLRYVMITRAMENLHFVSKEKDEK